MFRPLKVSTYVLMRILESMPESFDFWIKIVTLGKLNESYDRLAAWVKKGDRVLDIGCGTGALALRAAKRGARVKGIDINPRMLEIARKKSEELNANVEFVEMGIAELGREEDESYDAVMSGLVFSEMSDEEVEFALKEIRRILKKDGVLLVADEVVPEGLKKVLSKVLRFPFALITFIIAQRTSKPVRNLKERIEKAGFKIESVNSNRIGNFVEIVARNI